MADSPMDEPSDQEPTGFLTVDDRFIPVRAEDLAEVLARDVETFGPHAGALSAIAEAVTLVIDQEVGTFERELAHAYAPFNPDRDTLVMPGDEPSGEDGEANELMNMLENLLWQANFEEMDDDQLVAAIQAANSHGMRIRLDPERVRILRVWVRGHGIATQSRRPWRRPWTKESFEVPVLKRLVVAVRMRASPYVMLKLFKEIPISDLESLLPHAKVKMSPREMVKLAATGSGAIWTLAFKIITTGLAAAGHILYLVAVPLLALTWKTFSGYKRAIKDRDSERTKNLYFQNLANNASAIHMLATVVAQSEVKEALLAYAFCLAHKAEGERGALVDDLDQIVEAYLKATFDVDVNFDMPDALETMDRLGLWENRGRLGVVPPEQALALLETHRLERRSADYHAGVVE
jgi:hypothetical protein